ncbi:CRISPR-associated protein Csx16 [Paenibacillus agilis]|uniref:Uncharacterized protein n=1 Tax=Paenibacillus agilis TaxID=3020863 RepID=A0A559ICY5_9BACL|nr:CRISPR-associated protein Csx16 [Paenibacillus agilis]TVX85541.1 hypothetical protein FPZ44_24605 [Paenibacillus agilis]
MQTINSLLNTFKVVTTGFPAVAALGAHSKGVQEVVLSTLAPAALLDKGITEFYALEIPRDAKLASAEEIIAANLPVRKFSVSVASIVDLDTVIVSRHQGTVDILKETYPDAIVLASIDAEDIKGKHVVGTLPPHLIAACAAYTSVSIKDYDFAKDGDISGQELLDRIIVAPDAICVKEIVHTIFISLLDPRDPSYGAPMTYTSGDHEYLKVVLGQYLDSLNYVMYTHPSGVQVSAEGTISYGWFSDGDLAELLGKIDNLNGM